MGASSFGLSALRFWGRKKGRENSAPGSVPRHLAIIMDGNGRWARSRGLPRSEGHRAGGKTVRMVVEQCRRVGVRYLTLFCFSSENWGRPQEEVAALMRLFMQYLTHEVALLEKNGVRLRAVGRLDMLPPDVRESLEGVLKRTEKLEGMDLVLAISYGGREEIVDAVRKIGSLCASGQVEPAGISAELISRNLYAPDIPDPELLIRTSGEMRISNFLLWQLSYSEIVVSSLYWPEFTEEELLRCLSEFSKRQRRFGKTGEQVGGKRSGL